MNMKRSSCASGKGYVPSCSMGFCVAKTRNGSSNGYVRPPAVTRCSCMAWSSAACVLGGVRLISSAKSTLAKTGPGTKRKARRPVVWSSSSTSVPVMSLGIRSGVNWMRLKVSDSASAKVEMSSVLASPGTPTKRQCPREKSAMSSCSMTFSCPTTRLAISAAMRPRARASSSISSASPGSEGAAPFTADSTSFIPSSFRCELERFLLALLQRLILQRTRDLTVDPMQLRVEWIDRDAIVERDLRLVVLLQLLENLSVERLRRLVFGVGLDRLGERILGGGKMADPRLGERVAARDLGDVARQTGAGARIFVRGGSPAPSGEEDLAELDGPPGLGIRRFQLMTVSRGGLQR